MDNEIQAVVLYEAFIDIPKGKNLLAFMYKMNFVNKMTVLLSFCIS